MLLYRLIKSSLVGRISAYCGKVLHLVDWVRTRLFAIARRGAEASGRTLVIILLSMKKKENLIVFFRDTLLLWLARITRIRLRNTKTTSIQPTPFFHNLESHSFTGLFIFRISSGSLPARLTLFPPHRYVTNFYI